LRFLYVEIDKALPNGPLRALAIGIPIIAVPPVRMTGRFAIIKPHALLATANGRLTQVDAIFVCYAMR
jgi:hypothetical protein